jgi:Ras-related protein Rab-1A
MPTADGDLVYKILLVGDAGVGKTSIINRAADGTFTGATDSTLVGKDFKTFNTKTSDGKKNVQLRLWDTAGQERYHTVTASYYRGAHAVIFVYDISDRPSFENLKRWMEDVHRYCMSEVTFFVVGNKTDLVAEREVQEGQGKEFATESMDVPFFEVSAKSGDNINSAFTELGHLLSRSHSSAGSSSGKKGSVDINTKSSGSKKSTCILL